MHFLAVALLSLVLTPPAVPRLHVVSGVSADGAATPLWLAVLQKRLPEARYASVAPLRKGLTTDESAWDALIRSRVGAWQGMVPSIADLFAPIAGAPDVTIVLGNRGSEDAFTHDSATIGFDLSALQATYGDARTPENIDRIDRFFRHEFTHIMQKPWLQAHPWTADTPLRAALLDIWAEGLGNYRSLGAKYLPQAGQRSADAARVLEQLEPRFVARLAALACAEPARVPQLLSELSSGKFEQKWGALPPALWLAEEPGDPALALRAFVQSGPDGVWGFARRHLKPPLVAALDEAQLANRECTSIR